MPQHEVRQNCKQIIFIHALDLRCVAYIIDFIYSRCYKVEFSEKPTDAELYKDVECDKEYYVLTGQLLEGSYNDFRFPNVAFKPRMVPDKEQYEVDGTKGKLRALAVKPQKVELNKLVEFEGDWCVQKVGKFDN